MHWDLLYKGNSMYRYVVEPTNNHNQNSNRNFLFETPPFQAKKAPTNMLQTIASLDPSETFQRRL